MRRHRVPVRVERLGYSAMHVGDGRWNGVAIVAKGGLTPLSSALPGLIEARYANACVTPSAEAARCR